MRHLVHLLAFALTSTPQAPPVERTPQAPLVQAAPAVAAPKTFRTERYHAGHNCPNCGRSQYRISGWVGNGQHRHTCNGCGTSWAH